VQAGSIERGHVLRVPNDYSRFTVSSKAVHGGHAVSRVERKLTQYVLLRILTGLQAHDVADVTVRIDQPRNDRFAAYIDTFTVVWQVDGPRGPNGFDAPGPNEDNAVFNWRGTGSVYDRCTDESRCRTLVDSATQREKCGEQPNTDLT
jgi:hypothetical protein